MFNTFKYLQTIIKEDIKNLDLLADNEILVFSNMNKSLKNFWNNMFDRITVNINDLYKNYFITTNNSHYANI